MKKIIFFLTISLLTLSCKPNPKKLQRMDGKTVTLNGKLTKIGNEPFSKLGLDLNSHNIILIKDPKVTTKNFNTLNQSLGKNVSITGTFQIISKESADKKIKWFIYYLSVEKYKLKN